MINIPASQRHFPKISIMTITFAVVAFVYAIFSFVLLWEFPIVVAGRGLTFADGIFLIATLGFTVVSFCFAIRGLTFRTIGAWVTFLVFYFGVTIGIPLALFGGGYCLDAVGIYGSWDYSDLSQREALTFCVPLLF